MKFSCLHCDQHIECPDELAGKSTTCPTCQREITAPFPDGPARKLPPPPPVAIRPVVSEAQKIYDQAESTNNSANLCAFLMVLCIGATFLLQLPSITFASGFFLTLYLMNKIIAQLLHIRALLHRQIVEKD